MARIINLQSYLTKIHAANTRAVVIVTGGGSGVFPLLLNQGGGSNTLVGGILPWSDKETEALLGYRPEKFASEETARQLAIVAYRKALAERTASTPNTQKFIGVACSSSLMRTPEERAGRSHKIFAALHTAEKTEVMTIELFRTSTPTVTVGQATSQIKEDAFVVRRAEEDFNSRILLRLIGSGCEIDDILDGDFEFTDPALPRLPDWLTYHIYSQASGISHPDMLAFSRGEVGSLAFYLSANHEIEPSKRRHELFLSGSFNPFHAGHLEMLLQAEKDLGVGCALELSMQNVSKPSLDWLEVERRLTQISKDSGQGADKGCHVLVVYITNRALFVDKVLAFPQSTFVVGQDTAERIVDERYGSTEALQARLAALDARFLVFGREVNGVLRTGSEGFPDWFRKFAKWSEHRLKYAHVSSTEIRKVVGK